MSRVMTTKAQSTAYLITDPGTQSDSTCQVFQIRMENLLTALLCQGAHKVSEHEMDLMYSEDSESEGCIGIPRHLGFKYSG